MNKDYIDVLSKEDLILDDVLNYQKDLRKAVNDKSWTDLLSVISKINLSMDKFNSLDEEREKIAGNLASEDGESLQLLQKVRGKLVRTRTENKALSDYINITKNFVQGVIDRALPQSNVKVYTRNGYVQQKQPASVVVNTLF